MSAPEPAQAQIGEDCGTAADLPLRLAWEVTEPPQWSIAIGKQQDTAP